MARVRPESGEFRCLPGANIHCARPSRRRQPNLAEPDACMSWGSARPVTCAPLVGTPRPDAGVDLLPPGLSIDTGGAPERPRPAGGRAEALGGEGAFAGYLVQLVDHRLRLQRERAGSMLPLVVFEQSQLQRERAQVAPIVLGAVLQRERLQRERV